MPGYGDIAGGYPPLPYDTAPDLASLQYPWSDPPTGAPELQPGIGIPAAALDAAVPPPPVLGPPVAGAPPIEAPANVAGMPDIAISAATPGGGPGPPADPPALPSLAPPPPPLPGTELPPGVAGPTISPAEAHYRQTAQDYAGNPLAIPNDAEQRRALDSLDPFQLAEANTRFNEGRNAFIAERRRQYVEADAEAARQHMEDLKAANAATQAKMDATLADAQRLADTKVDPSGGVHGGRLLAGVLASIVGGLVQGRTGSARNAGLDALQGAIDRGIEAQKAEIANKKGAIDMKRNVLAGEFARHGDMYQAEEAVRLASWKHADDMLAYEQQSYDPRGSMALNIANQRRQIGAAIQQSQAATQQKWFDNHLKQQNAAREQELADSTVWHNKAQIDLGNRQLNSAAADRAAARDQRQADKDAERADKAAERRRQFAIGGVPRVQVSQDGKPVLGPDGKPAVTYENLKNADGTDWEAESPEATRELRQKKSSATEVISIIDEIRGIRDRVGGESRLLNSDDAQRLGVLQARAKLLTKAGTQGMSSDKDMETLQDASGTSSADSWRSQEAKLREARARTESALNVAFRDAKYSGPAITYPEAQAPQNTAAEDEQQALLRAPPGGQEGLAQELEAEVKRRTLGMSPEQRQAFDPRSVYPDVAKSYDPGASSDQRSKIGELAKAAAGTGEAAIEASAKLQRIATEAQTVRLRTLAAAALTEAQQASLPGEAAAAPPIREVAHERLPPVPPPGKGKR